MGAITHQGEVLQGLPANASQINFDKTGTNLNSTQTENAIKEVNTKANTLQSEKADTDIVASDFSTAVSYTAGNYCVQDGKLYRFKNNHSGAWSASDVEEVKITGELSALRSGLTDLHYHKVAESASTGTYAVKLQSLSTAYNNLSLAQKRSALLVMNSVDIYHPVNCSGNWFSVWVDSSAAYSTRYGIDGSAYIETGGTVTDNASVENANVFELWICEP